MWWRPCILFATILRATTKSSASDIKVLSEDKHADSIVKMTLEYQSFIGFFFDERHILTTYNPIRPLVTQRELMKRFEVDVKTERLREVDGVNEEVDYFIRIDCARQVIPVLLNEVKQEPNCHGHNCMQTPFHDILVLKAAKSVVFASDNKTDRPHLNAVRVDIAKPHDALGSHDLMFYNIDFDYKKGTDEIPYFTRYEDTTSKGVIKDCEELIPKEWGHFICLKNIWGHPEIFSGAPLFHKNKLFGIGTFTLNKGYSRIIVFTDLRPYYYAIFETCSMSDRYE